MGNTENLDDLIANGGEPEETEEEKARREEALKRLEEYYKLIFSGDYNVRVLDPNKKQPEAGTVYVYPESQARLVTKFGLKALQNKGNISTLTWDSSGNVANFQMEANVWDRIGVSCCATGTKETPYFVQSYSEHILDSSDTHGNKNFKAVMVKADYQVIVPAYSEVTLNVTMNIHVFKRGGETSSTWIGAIISNKDTWTPIVGGNGKWADNNGVIKTDYPSDCTLADGCGKKENLRLSLTNYNCGTQKNTSGEAKLWVFTLYIMGNIEKSSTINQRLLLFDRIEDKFSAGYTGTGEITYDPNGGIMTGGTTQKISFSSEYDTETSLYTAEREGYTLAGWKDETSGRVYAAGGTYVEKRGMKLTAQWIPDQIDCRIEHYKQGLDGQYPDMPTEYDVVKTLAGKTFVPNRRNYEGFVVPQHCEGNETCEVVPDGKGTTVVKFYYERKKYQLVFLANGGIFSCGENENSDYIKTEVCYGKELQYPKLMPRQDYSFEGWTENLSAMPAHDVTIKVIWQKND